MQEREKIKSETRFNRETNNAATKNAVRRRRNQSSIHRRDTESAEIGVILDQEIFSLRPQRLRGEFLVQRRKVMAAEQKQERRNKTIFTAETQSSQRSDYFLIKNSLLCVLSASAVNLQ